MATFSPLSTLLLAGNAFTLPVTTVTCGGACLLTAATIAEYSDLYAGRSVPWQAADLKEGLGPVPEVTVPIVEELNVNGEAAAEDGVTSY